MELGTLRSVMTADTTDPAYWLNWRFLLCSIWILSAIIAAAILIWRFEGFGSLNSRKNGCREENVGIVYKDEAWKTCSKSIHPLWLLAFRVIAFSIMLTLLISDIVIKSPRIFYFYTEWTFTLVTLYFGLASIFSIHGCLHFRNEVQGADSLAADDERGAYVAPTIGECTDIPDSPRNLNSTTEEPRAQETADVWGYAFQIIFQTCAGAVLLTDLVFWFIIYPFLTNNDYKLDLLKVSMHSVNAILFLGDVIFNSLRFPLFRVAYFVLWTCIFVIFQWIIHACVSIWWPYPFLDLSSPYAPLWYVAVGLITLPSYAAFFVMVKFKKDCWAKAHPKRGPILR